MQSDNLVCWLTYNALWPAFPSGLVLVCRRASAGVSAASATPKQTAFRLPANWSPVISHMRMAPLGDQQGLWVTWAAPNETAPGHATDNWFWSKKLCVTGNRGQIQEAPTDTGFRSKLITAQDSTLSIIHSSMLTFLEHRDKNLHFF